jgi:Na+-driven multidrug efflux pump
MFFGVAMNAARGLSIQVLSVLNQFANGISQAITPQITKSYAAGNLQRSIKLTFVLTKAQGILLFVIALPLMLEIDFILGIWLKEVPYYASTFSKWAIILCIARTLQNTHSPLFLATGDVKKLQIVAGGIMLLNLPLSYIALKIGCQPVVTMIIGVCIEFLVMWIAFYYLKTNVGFPIGKYYKQVVIPIIFTAAIAALLPAYIRYNLLDEGFLRFVVVTVVSVIITSILSYLFVINNSEKTILRKYIVNKISN